MIRMVHGFYELNSENIGEVFASFDIKKWKVSSGPVSLYDCLKRDPSLIEEAGFRSALNIEVVSFLDPRGNTFTGFRHKKGGDGTVVLALFPNDFIPVCAEFRHGCEEVVLNLPGGIIKNGEKPEDCARREFEEEVGIPLDGLEAMNIRGNIILGRDRPQRNFGFIGFPKIPILKISQSLDDNEFVNVFMVKIDEWLKLIDLEYVEHFSVVTTHLALRRLNNLSKNR